VYYATRRLARRTARRTLTPRLSRLSSLRARLEAVNSAVAGLRENTPAILSVPALARLMMYRNYLEQQVRADAACTQIRPAYASGVVARTIFKKISATSTVAGRSAAEKHIQSVRHMLKAERGLSA
jgi:hypothetical protein